MKERKGKESGEGEDCQVEAETKASANKPGNDSLNLYILGICKPSWFSYKRRINQKFRRKI